MSDDVLSDDHFAPLTAKKDTSPKQQTNGFEVTTGDRKCGNKTAWKNQSSSRDDSEERVNSRDDSKERVKCIDKEEAKHIPDKAEESERDFSSLTPPCFNWSRDISFLLRDLEGINLFKKFLTEENCRECLDFWLACEGIKKTITSTSYLHQLIRVIYKKFIRSAVVQINPETRKEITDKIEQKLGLEQSIFNKAQRDVEQVMSQTVYPNFLKSDIFLGYIHSLQNYGHLQSEKHSCSSESSSSTGSEPGSRQDTLPTLHEDTELSIEQVSKLSLLTSEAVKPRMKLKGRTDHIPYESHSGKVLHAASRSSKPCHIRYSTYLPTSAQDSDLQSLSSDIPTDDTMSVTDNSSLECFPLTSKYQLKKQHRTMKKHALMNKDSLSSLQLNPCHYVYPKDMPPPIEPEKFAAILTEKLLHVKKKLEVEEKMEESLRKVEAEDSFFRPSDASLSSSSFERFARIPPQLITAAMKEKLSRTDESDQSILDEHVSRVWKDSNRTSPDCSPPRNRGLDWGIEPSQEVPINPYQVLRSPHMSRHYISGRHRRERDNCSSDSGTVPDFTPENERTNLSVRPIHVYRHVHHHYLSPIDNSTAPLFKGNNMGPEPVGNEERRRSKETTRRSKKVPPGDSSSSCVDSGVSMVGGTVPPMDVTERVYNWIRDKEKYRSQSHGPDVERESSSKHKKSSRSGTSLVPSASSKQSQSKKPLAYNTSRSGSLERGGSSPWLLPLSSGHIPHPRSSAKDVPLLDPVTQHSESKRRPEDDSRSKSAKPNSRKPGKKSLSTAATGGEVTIIGYCFAGESVPYRTRLPGKKITLKQFKSLLSKKGNFRYFFKRECNEFGTGVINEEISDENEVLPLWEGKIFALIQPID